MKRLWHHAAKGLRQWSFGIFMLLCTNATTMAIPELSRRAIDHLKAGTEAAVLVRIAWMMVGVALLGAVFRTLSRVLILNAARDVELSLRMQFYARLTRQGPDFFGRYPTGDLMSRATNDLTQIRLMLGPGLLNIVNTLVAYGTALPLMLRIDGRLTLVAFFIYPPAILIMRRLGRALYTRNRAQQASLGRLSNVIQENLAASALVRAFAVEREQTRKFAAHNDDYLTANLNLVWLRSAMFRISASVSSIGVLLVALFGAREVLQERLTLGAVVAMMEYMALLSGPTSALGWVLSLWQRGLSSIARLDEVIRAEVTVVGGTQSLQDPQPALAVRNLHVNHGDGRGLQGITFTLAPGETLGVVGSIGSGKSTLVRALLRLVHHTGDVKLGQQDTRDLTLDALRGAFSYVPQNPTLLSKTLAENIAFGSPHASAADLDEVLEIAAMDQEARALPQGLQTPIGERGVTLSGGQKQRCALARALLRRAPILLLDDTLSAVDTSTEVRILAGLRRRQAGRTTLIVAHRVSAVMHANNIIVLHEGALMEQGTHEALVAHGGLYAEIYQKQQLAEQDGEAAEQASGSDDATGQSRDNGQAKDKAGANA